MQLSGNVSDFVGGDPIGSMPINEAEGLRLERDDLKKERDALKKKLADLTNRANQTEADLRRQVTTVQNELSSLRSENSRLRNRSGSTSTSARSVRCCRGGGSIIISVDTFSGFWG